MRPKHILITSQGLSADITQEIADDLALANSLFIPQQNVNSIGLGKKGIIYAVRSIILRTFFKHQLSDQLFSMLDGDYIYLHKYTISLINHLYNLNSRFNFSEDYSTIYWENEDSVLILTQPRVTLEIPTDEELECFVPNNESAGSFSTDIEELKDALNFFEGFYAGSVWKPIRFEISAGKEVELKYTHPSANITKALSASGTQDGTFALDSETLKKTLAKVKDKRDERDEPLTAEFTYEDGRLGVHCTIGDSYDIIFALLTEEE